MSTLSASVLTSGRDLGLNQLSLKRGIRVPRTVVALEEQREARRRTGGGWGLLRRGRGGPWGDECLNSVQAPHHPPRALGAGAQARLCRAEASRGKEGAGPDPGCTGRCLQLSLPDAPMLSLFLGWRSEPFFSLMSRFHCLKWCWVSVQFPYALPASPPPGANTPPR